MVYSLFVRNYELKTNTASFFVKKIMLQQRNYRSCPIFPHVIKNIIVTNNRIKHRNEISERKIIRK